MKSLMIAFAIFSASVTPLVGVWIEMYCAKIKTHKILVTPLVGVWIEIIIVVNMYKLAQVTPLVGVWIEISVKLSFVYVFVSHSPCGSVD